MTKERLEEIRKRKYAEDRIVYTVFDNDEEATALHIVYDDELLVAYMMLKRVYETKEEAEWYCKTHAERIEKFEPPMWEFLYLDNGYCFKTIVGNKVLRFIVSLYTIEIKFQEDIDCLFLEKSTKENYEKACEIVRDLFKGESNEKCS